jgi:hypothetical protein
MTPAAWGWLSFGMNYLTNTRGSVRHNGSWPLQIITVTVTAGPHWHGPGSFS